MSDLIGFRVRIEDPATGQAEDDMRWQSMLGGGEAIPFRSTPAGDVRTSSPGHKSVGEITLRGAMTDKRAALCAWINDTVSGKPWKRNLTITELLSDGGSVKDGKSYVYFDCVVTGYSFPRLSTTSGSCETMEEVRIKPIRCELK